MTHTPTDFQCPQCGRLASLPWDAAWCLHHDSNFQPRPPDAPDWDWARMNIVTQVASKSPAPPDQWVVVEYQNPYGREAEFGDWTYRIASEVMSEADAYGEAARRPPRDGWERHMHGWRVFPKDLADRWADGPAPNGG